MILKEDVNKKYQLSKEIEDIDKQILELTDKKKALEEQVKQLNTSLLNAVKDEKKDKENYDVEFDGLFLTYFAKTNVEYTSDKDVLNYLIEKKLTNLYKTKVTTTTSIDKNALKKELKTNKELEEGLGKFIVKKLTEYVTVTDGENHTKMLEHIAENKKD